MGLIAMSERDLQRIEVLSKVTDGRTTLVSAAHALGLSERQVRRLLGRVRTSVDVDQFLRIHSLFCSYPYRFSGSSSQAGLRNALQCAGAASATSPVDVEAACFKEPCARRRSIAREIREVGHAKEK
jgi:hypothetical protein